MSENHYIPYIAIWVARKIFGTFMQKRIEEKCNRYTVCNQYFQTLVGISVEMLAYFIFLVITFSLWSGEGLPAFLRGRGVCYLSTVLEFEYIVFSRTTD